MLDTPIYIHELSVGGCLIESHHEERVGSQVQLEIDLPYGGSLTMDGEILYLRPDYGFVVKFINLSDEQQDQLDTAIRRLHAWRSNHP
jgi:hypothetical protein